MKSFVRLQTDRAAKASLPPRSFQNSRQTPASARAQELPDHESVSNSERLCRAMFLEIGEDANREGLQRTPERFRKSMAELTSGYKMTPEEVVGEGIFTAEGSGPVFVRDIEFFSLCEHHVLPFWGKVSIGYLPNGKILGLSKLARIVDVYARRLQVQERLTAEVGQAIHKLVDARAVVVTVEASHMCMMMRGVRKQESTTRTEFQAGLENLTADERVRMWKGIES